jgi:hypothetical protein
MSSVFWAQVNTRVLSAETLQSGAAVDWHINLHTIFQVRDAVGEPQNHPTVCRTGDHPEEYSTCAFSEGRLRSAVIWQSSYLLDATNPNRLWFHQFRERNWLSLNGLLRQSIEQFAA